MRKLEKRKYHGGYFAQNIRTLTSYFSGKHLLGPDIADDAISAYSGGEASKMSASPRADSTNAAPHNAKRPKMEDFSPSPIRSYADKMHHLSVHVSSAGKDKDVDADEKQRGENSTRTAAKIQPFGSQHRKPGDPYRTTKQSSSPVSFDAGSTYSNN